MTQPGRIALERHLTQPPALVWRYLTEPHLISTWWVPCDIRPEVGCRFTFDMGKWGMQAAEVTKVIPERFFAYTFSPGKLETVISWTLSPNNKGTVLLLVHEGFDLESPIGKAAFEGMGNGWPAILDRLGVVAHE